MKNILSPFKILTIPLSSRIGYFNLKRKALRRDLSVWNSSFNQKKVLIVGSGPSLDKVNSKYFSGFDVIIYINHAIKLANNNQNYFFFTTDIAVALDISTKSYFEKIRNIKKERSIIAPGNFDQTLRVSNEFESCFSWIRACEGVYKKYQSNKSLLGFTPSILYYRPTEINEEKLNYWFSQSNQVNYFPIFETTSALTAIIFAAKYRPISISLIGCDFSKGRSKEIIGDNDGHTHNPFLEAPRLFEFLRSYLEEQSISVTNDSWIK